MSFDSSTSNNLRSILVVDDEAVNREMLSRLLQRAGYSAEAVSGAASALNLIASRTFDLVLLDVVMPQMDGFQCLHEIRKLRSACELPVIMVTAETDRSRIIQAFRSGANDYVTKPIDREITLARILTHTQLRAGRIALQESEERYALASRGSNDGLWDWNVIKGEVYYSARWKEMLGHSDAEVGNTPEDWYRRIHQEDRAKFCSVMSGSGSEESNLTCEIRMAHCDGGYRWMICRGVSVRDASGAVVRMAGSLTDITEGKVGDALTGLPNRLLFRDRLERAIERFRRYPTTGFAVMFLDLDEFKLVNDSLGHQAGDELLLTIANRLRDALRGMDSVAVNRQPATVARHAGDEFTILLEEITNPADVEGVARRILDDIARPVTLASRVISPSVSIGWTTSKREHLTADDMLREADTAMYHAKSAGRGQAKCFESAMQDIATRRLELENDLRQGIERGEFLLYYQPIVSLLHHQICGFESLVRWQHPTRGLVPPLEFIQVAEETGLIVPLGWKIAEMACLKAAAWAREFPGREPVVAINVSARQFAEPDFVQRLESILSSTGARPELLYIEVTEGLIMGNPEVFRALLSSIRKLGIRIAIDDFGTGFSSLAYLHSFAIDVLKIDRSFVSALDRNQENIKIIRTIVELGRSLGLRLIAEGVETVEQLASLEQIGCEFAQGFLWSRPVPAEQATELLRQPIANSPPIQYPDVLIPSDLTVL